MRVWFAGFTHFALALKCWEGSSTHSELSLGPPFAAGMHEVECNGMCHLVSEHCEDKSAAVTIARCVDKCPSRASSAPSDASPCEICCNTDLCNSRPLLTTLKLDSPFTIFSLPINSMRVGISGENAEKDLCATLVLMEPSQDGCFGDEGSVSAYVSLYEGVENCGWTYSSNVDSASFTGCWKNLEKNKPEISINATISSSIFNGKLLFHNQEDIPETAVNFPSEKDPSPSSPRILAVDAKKANGKQSAPVFVKANGHNIGRFSVSTGRSNDDAQVAVSDKTLVVQLSSPFGIGRATVTKTKGVWPKNKVIFLNLRGLEKFQVSNDDITLHASVSSNGESVRLWANEAELTALPERAKMEIAVVNEREEEMPLPYRFPLADGLRFRIALPPVLFNPNVPSINLEWIDFYR